jgi:Sec-independent protein translocase protein TatA
MNKKLLSISTTISILILAISTNHLLAQNAAANQAASELGQSSSSVLDKAGDKVGSALGELKQNMSTVGSELGQNMSTVGTEILNNTEEAAKKVGTGVADVLSNISGEIKEGINGK